MASELLNELDKSRDDLLKQQELASDILKDMLKDFINRC